MILVTWDLCSVVELAESSVSKEKSALIFKCWVLLLMIKVPYSFVTMGFVNPTTYIPESTLKLWQLKILQLTGLIIK